MVGYVAAQVIVALLLTLPLRAAMRYSFVSYSVMLLALKLYYSVQVGQKEINPYIRIKILFIFNAVFLYKVDVVALQIASHITFSYALSAIVTFGTAMTTTYLVL